MRQDIRAVGRALHPSGRRGPSVPWILPKRVRSLQHGSDRLTKIFRPIVLKKTGQSFPRGLLVSGAHEIDQVTLVRVVFRAAVAERAVVDALRERHNRSPNAPARPKTLQTDV